MTGGPAPHEAVLSQHPFVVGRRVNWGDCDPAGVVYTPRFGDYVVEAGQLFLGHVLGGGFVGGKARHGVGLPCKAQSMVFHASLRPDEVFHMAITVGRIGTRTFELVTEAAMPDGTPVFSASTTLIAIHTDRRESRPLPASLLQALEPHRKQDTASHD